MKTLLIVLALTSISLTSTSQAMTLEDYIKTATEKSKLLKSYDASIEASEDARVSGDVELSPKLTADYSVATDKSLPSSTADRRDLTKLNLGYSQVFSSGTTLGLNAHTNKHEYVGSLVSYDGYSTGGVGLSVKQSLWKNSFGAATRLRQDLNLQSSELEKTSVDLQKRQELIDIESAFWDYVVAVEDLKLKKANLDRAKKLEQWTSKRVYNGISDASDLYQVKALSARRELDLASAVEELKNQEIEIRKKLALKNEEPLPVFVFDLSKPREYVAALQNKNKVVKISSYLSSLQSEVKQTSALSVEDSHRPDLAFVGSYDTSSYNLDHSEMLNNISKTDRPITYVGLSLTWTLSDAAKKAQKSAAKKEALAAKLKAEKDLDDGVEAWEEFLRTYKLSLSNVEIQERIAKFQSERSREEQQKFSKGRTITSNVVTAETDSAEAQVAFLRAKSNLRKLEASTQLYMAID